jgi:RNA 3'-phosphate cyclase
VDPVAIDGSLGEGGGQVVRTAIALSAITGRPCRLTRIRARRANPGLAAQHLAGIEAARVLAGAAVEGARPGALRGGEARFEVGTAGAVTLVVQVVAPIALFAPAPLEVTVTGGTDVPWSPLADYCEGVFLEHLRRLGARVRLAVVRRGSYPKGGGEVRLSVEPWAPAAAAIALEAPGAPARLEVTSLASDDLRSARVAERQIEGFARAADPAWGEVDARATYARMRSPGTSLTARLVTGRTVLGACALGARGKRAEKVGAEAAALLHAEWASGAAVDRWMADQLIPYLGLLGGTVRTSAITSHTETNLKVVERFLPVRFAIEGSTIHARRTGGAAGS